MDERDTPELPLGTSINGAVVEALVKAGGYGTVYRARDKLSGTLLALKFIPLYRAEQWAQREFSVSLSLHHENLVQQVGFGYWPDNAPRFMWLKMLYVEGRELDAWAWAENPDARTVAGKVLGVARALAVVHDQGVVHRDVKEANSGDTDVGLGGGLARAGHGAPGAGACGGGHGRAGGRGAGGLVALGAEDARAPTRGVVRSLPDVEVPAWSGSSALGAATGS